MKHYARSHGVNVFLRAQTSRPELHRRETVFHFPRKTAPEVLHVVDCTDVEYFIMMQNERDRTAKRSCTRLGVLPRLNAGLESAFELAFKKRHHDGQMNAGILEMAGGLLNEQALDLG